MTDHNICQQYIATLTAKFGDRVVEQIADMRDSAQMRAIFDTLKERAGRGGTIKPGFVETRSEIKPIAEWRLEGAQKSSPGGRIVVPRDVAKASLFLAADKAASTNGMAFSIMGVRGVDRLG